MYKVEFFKKKLSLLTIIIGEMKLTELKIDDRPFKYKEKMIKFPPRVKCYTPSIINLSPQLILRREKFTITKPKVTA